MQIKHKNALVKVVLFFIMYTISIISFAFRDPTQPVSPPVAYSVDDTGLIVKMIKRSGNHIVADVDGKIVQIGDEIYGMKVMAINQDFVLLETTTKIEIKVPVYKYVVEKRKVKDHENNL